MGGIDNDVVQRSRRTAQRHVIVAFHARVAVANHLAVSLGDKDDDVRLSELCSEKRAVRTLGPGRCRHEALRVEVVVSTDEECAESANDWGVCGRCYADADGVHVRTRASESNGVGY